MVLSAGAGGAAPPPPPPAPPAPPAPPPPQPPPPALGNGTRSGASRPLGGGIGGARVHLRLALRADRLRAAYLRRALLQARAPGARGRARAHPRHLPGFHLRAGLDDALPRGDPGVR